MAEILFKIWLLWLKFPKKWLLCLKFFKKVVAMAEIPKKGGCYG